MKIAVIGSGGREHAIISKLSASPAVEKIFAIPGNGGTENNIPLSVNDFDGIKSFCENEGVGLIFVGPEDPLQAGIVDYFSGSNIKVFGPDKRAAQLESSKIYAKQFMQKYGVATAAFQAFTDLESALEFCHQWEGNCVIKYDGLAAGKGVFVCSDMDEATFALGMINTRYGANAPLLIEEKLTGQELSLLAFTDGVNYKLLLPSQDHKQLLEGDEGPNTGGMGAFCPVDFCDAALLAKIEETIIKPAFKGIAAENFNYHGVLYFGLMINNNIPQVLEFNVRLGDPETEVVLPALKSDLFQLVNACFDGSLADLELEFHPGYFVDVVLVSGGYPGVYVKYLPITGLENINCQVFHAGTKLKNSQLVTSGGRVLNIVHTGKTLPEAIANCYAEVKKITFKDVFYRKDIGNRKNI
ncbi:MAG: phosphoribosylamine--glycine ligase [Candidatus Cloacimonetes bacterium]|nr:phosphoribosylamine--glycine ligase [Candidatus Cloacimonadota bacterium]